MAKTKTDTQAIENTDVSPDINTVLAQAGETAAQGNDTGAITHKPTSAKAMLAALKAKGATAEYAGGALPPLVFKAIGDCYLVRYMGRKTVESGKANRKNDTFDVMAFEVLDPATFDPKDGSAEIIGMGSLAEFATLNEPMAGVKKGDVIIITYQGQGPQRSGESRPHLFSVDKVWPASAETAS